MKTLSIEERHMLASLLRQAAEEFSAHGCNDFNVSAYLKPEAIEHLHDRMEAFNGGDRLSGNIVPDWYLMEFFAEEIVE